MSAEKNDVMVKYATYGMDSNLFVAKYQLYLPEKNDLKSLITSEFENIGK